MFITNWHLPIPIGILAGILTGILCGLFSGFAVAKMNIPPFIATLAVMMMTKGLSLVISHAKPIYFNETPAFREIVMGTALEKVIPGFAVPNAILIFFGLAIISSLVLTKTVIGRYNFALGSNEEATRLSGVNIRFWKTSIYVLTGLFSGIAGVMIASRLDSAQPALGMGYGGSHCGSRYRGTSLSGGQGSILGTVIGALIMSVMTNGLRILSVPQEWQTVIVGIVVLLAVYADILRRRKAG